jgi:hypothetical protein
MILNEKNDFKGQKMISKDKKKRHLILKDKRFVDKQL